jgi:hypothetical protein
MSNKVQIVLEFDNEEEKNWFCGQMSDGFGENFCDFCFSKRLDGTDGTKAEHYIKIKDELDREVYFVNKFEEEEFDD